MRASLAAEGRTLPESDRVRLRTNLVERIALSRLIMARATADEKAECKKLAEKYVEEVKKKAPSEEAFQRRLDATGMKLETFLARAEEEATVRKVIEREVASKITIADETIKKYYDDNEKSFDLAEMVKAAHIFVLTVDASTRAELSEERKKEKREKIEKLLVRAKAGEDFGKLAKEFSEDSGSKANGGEYTFARGKLGIPEFEAAAFALLPGQISDVVTSQLGYHIVKVIEKLPPRKLPLSEVSLRLKDGLLAQEIQKQLPEYYKKVKEDAGLQLFLDDEK